MILYRCGLVIAFMCGLAALTILATILTNKLSDSIAAVSFVVVGGLSWLAGRAAKNALADFSSHPPLPAGTTVTGIELFEAVQTTAGVGQSVQLSLTQMMTLGGLPSGGATGPF